MKLERGDRVHIRNLGVDGEVIEVDTRTVVVRYKKTEGDLVERRFPPEDLDYIPKPHMQ
jgi:hypothetical protein